MPSGGPFDVDGKRARVGEISRIAEDPAFWGDNQRAQALLEETARLAAAPGEFARGVRALVDAAALDELAEHARDEAARAEAAAHAGDAARLVEALEFRRMLSGPHDRANA